MRCPKSTLPYFFEEHTADFIRDLTGAAQRLWPALHKKIRLQSYIFDFALQDNKNLQILRVLPLEKHQEAFLFNWVMDESVLLTGPFEIRYRQKANKEDRKSVV